MSQARSLNPDKGPVGKHKPDGPGLDDKLKTLIAFRRKNGLCFKCGEKWNRQHQCPQQIPLHIIEELLEVLDFSDDDNTSHDDTTTATNSPVMVVSDAAQVPPAKRRTMQLKGLMGKQKVLILVDSGSIASFVSDNVVQ